MSHPAAAAEEHGDSAEIERGETTRQEQAGLVEWTSHPDEWRSSPRNSVLWPEGRSTCCEL